MDFRVIKYDAGRHNRQPLVVMIFRCRVLWLTISPVARAVIFPDNLFRSLSHTIPQPLGCLDVIQ